MKQYLTTDWDFNSERLVEVIDELPLWSAPFGLKLLDGINYRKGMSVLDIGPGTGFPLTEIAMRLGETSKIYGIDPWDKALNRAKKKINIYDITNVELIKGAAESIPMNDRSVDLIISNNGLNNVADLEKAISECSRVIKSKGQFIQTMNSQDTMFEFYSTMESVLRNLKLDIYLESMRKHIYEKRRPLDQYLGLLQANGFKITSTTHHEFFYKFADGTSMLNHHFIRLFS